MADDPIDKEWLDREVRSAERIRRLKDARREIVAQAIQIENLRRRVREQEENLKVARELIEKQSPVIKFDHGQQPYKDDMDRELRKYAYGR